MILALLSKSLSASFLSASLLVLAAAPASAQQSQQPRTTQPPAATTAKPQQARPGQATSPAPAQQQARPGAASNPQKPATQAAKPAAGAAAGPGGAAATLVGSFGDWSVYTAQTGRSKICYAISQPKDRQPKGLSRDPAYLFVSFRPAENVKNEVALVMGFKTKEDGIAEAAIGNAKYALLAKEENAWLKNPAEEGKAIGSMSKGQSLVVKVQSLKGNQLTDRYSLAGFGPAIERARKECP